MENWKPIPGYEGWYEVSDAGRVRSLERTTSHGRKRKQKVLKAVNDGKYLRVNLSKDNQKRLWLVHQLVLTAFVGPGNGRIKQARHLNGDPEDNRLENLCWGSAKENAADRAKHGRPFGRGSPKGLATWHQTLVGRLLKEAKDWTSPKPRGIYRR